MLRELRVRDLGVIDDLAVLLGPGMTALTGETGAGKTLIVGAIELLLGGRADPVLVRPGAAEALVEGRFDGAGDDELAPGGADLVLARAVPAAGRSRAYVGGRMAPLGALAETGGALVDLHGQHAHQALFSAGAQRAALDRAGGVDLGPLHAARRRVADLDAALAALGGDERARALEVDLLRHQLGELTAAGLDDPAEEDRLRAEEDRLADAGAHRGAAAAVHHLLGADDGAGDRVGAALAACAGRSPLEGLAVRLRDLQAELADVAADARDLAEAIEDDPGRLAEVGARRAVLAALRRKYGDTIGEVIAHRDATASRLEELATWEARAGEVGRARDEAVAEVAAAAAAVGAARRAAAPRLAAAVEAQLRALAMPRARFEVLVGGGAEGAEVTWLLGANPGEPALPLAKVASGGELARTMLALRLALSGLDVTGAGPAAAGGPPAGSARTLVFDEVDAGVGGEAAVAVGRALAALATEHQVLVVTHLPQVAAFADHHLAVRKEESGGRTRTTATALDAADRVVELSRMLSGRPGSATGRRHAEELLAAAHGGGPPARASRGRVTPTR